MEFRVLGPVEVVAGGRVLEPGPPQQRLVLAALVVDACRVVDLPTLIDRVWDQAPSDARRVLHVYISRLRRLCAQATGVSSSPRLMRRHGGYVLEVDPELVDLHRFRRLLEQARAADRGDPQRLVRLREAVRLWRGEPLSGLDGQWASRTRHAWNQQHVDGVVAWAQAELDLSNPGVVIEPVAELLVRFPQVEPLVAVLMRALYASGRTAEALARYMDFRQQLVAELGVDPGAELQAVHQRILRGEPVPDPGPVGRVSGSGLAVAPPQQLPPDVAWFTGRVPELERLVAMVPDAGQFEAVVISAIDGMAGIGKTALAVRAAHRMADRFPDGQLFIDLHGHTQGLTPVEPAEALDRMLRDLGIPGSQIPASLDARAALYRTRLANQQILIVLDNAATEAQVTPLLPGTPGSLVLVTSRRRLAGLDRTHTLSLDTLPTPDAITLFTRTADQSRVVDQPPGLLAELVQVCGWLPLAIRVAAARLRSHPSWRVADLVQRLRDQRHRLGELEAGQRSVTAALDLSYRHLSPDQQQVYRLLGVHPGVEYDGYATAALLGSTLPQAGRVLDQLLEAHLVQEPTPGRYRFHDLTRAHAATRHEPVSTSDAAHGRLLDYYRHTAAAAMDTAYPYEREHRPHVPSAHTPSPQLTDPAAALAWLEMELPNLLAAARSATEHDRPAYLLHLSTILHSHLRTRGRYHDANTLHHQALTIASAASAKADQLNALTGLGDLYLRQGRYGHAVDHFQQALQIARATGDRPGELNALTGLGHVQRLQGRPRQAAKNFEQALQIARATGHRPGELNALTGLGDIHRLQGRHGQAADHLEQALRIARAIGHRVRELDALNRLGHIHLWQGRYAPAADNFEQALRIAHTTGHRIGELDALNGLGHLHRLQGQYAPAADNFERALRIAHATGHSVGELNALNGLGDIHRLQGRHEPAAEQYQRLLNLAQSNGDRNHEFEAWQGMGRLSHATGRPESAIAHHARALALAGELGQPADQARAHDGLAHAHRARNQLEQARTHWQHALDLLSGLGVDHIVDETTTSVTIRAHLTALGTSGQDGPETTILPPRAAGRDTADNPRCGAAGPAAPP